MRVSECEKRVVSEHEEIGVGDERKEASHFQRAVQHAPPGLHGYSCHRQWDTCPERRGHDEFHAYIDGVPAA